MRYISSKLVLSSLIVTVFLGVEVALSQAQSLENQIFQPDMSLNLLCSIPPQGGSAEEIIVGRLKNISFIPQDTLDVVKLKVTRKIRRYKKDSNSAQLGRLVKSKKALIECEDLAVELAVAQDKGRGRNKTPTPIPTVGSTIQPTLVSPTVSPAATPTATRNVTPTYTRTPTRTPTRVPTNTPGIYCTPISCAAVGASCGSVSNGCGGTLNCGSCLAPETCGGGGIPNVCGGVPLDIRKISKTNVFNSAQVALDFTGISSRLDGWAPLVRSILIGWPGGSTGVCPGTGVGDTPSSVTFLGFSPGTNYTVSMEYENGKVVPWTSFTTPQLIPESIPPKMLSLYYRGVLEGHPQPDLVVATDGDNTLIARVEFYLGNSATPFHSEPGLSGPAGGGAHGYWFFSPVPPNVHGATLIIARGIDIFGNFAEISSTINLP